MKKLIPLLISSILVVGTFGCQEATKTSSETSTTNEASQPAKEAAQKTATGAKNATETGKTAVKEGAAKTTAKSLILSKLSEKIPGSKLVVEDKDGVVTVKGTVPTEADLKKIEPLVKEQKGVKSVKVEAKAASAKAQ
jgi:hyperosmotically inducible periplasmic protein